MEPIRGNTFPFDEPVEHLGPPLKLGCQWFNDCLNCKFPDCAHPATSGIHIPTSKKSHAFRVVVVKFMRGKGYADDRIEAFFDWKVADYD